MRHDRTHYQCDRCGGTVIEDAGKEPPGRWWDLVATSFGRSADRAERKVVLCSTCVLTLQSWLRNDPPHTHPGEMSGEESSISDPLIGFAYVGNVAGEPEPGGGYFTVFVNRDLPNYPHPGAPIFVEKQP